MSRKYKYLVNKPIALYINFCQVKENKIFCIVYLIKLTTFYSLNDFQKSTIITQVTNQFTIQCTNKYINYL
ncbi:hypothetical protein H1P_360029 [Hyella patelloides LEGE 07179]|uniref:Uncharacterized protein n=1 Tax=Hyella patelloides LEGE 07179 TaxID=945734 RepID=A0A563VW56_9CYAN|nr:hypothetical protein H1P_360029 [Hyella patelloides LEGE 07179]